MQDIKTDPTKEKDPKIEEAKQQIQKNLIDISEHEKAIEELKQKNNEIAKNSGLLAASSSVKFTCDGESIVKVTSKAASVSKTVEKATIDQHLEDLLKKGSDEFVAPKTDSENGGSEDGDPLDQFKANPVKETNAEVCAKVSKVLSESARYKIANSGAVLKAVAALNDPNVSALFEACTTLKENAPSLTFEIVTPPADDVDK
jgi:hypothetical protein